VKHGLAAVHIFNKPTHAARVSEVFTLIVALIDELNLHARK